MKDFAMSNVEQPIEGVEIEEPTGLSGENTQEQESEAQSVDTEGEEEAEGSGEASPENEAEPDLSGEQSEEEKKEDLPIGIKKRFAKLTKQKAELRQQLRMTQEENARLRSGHSEPTKARDDFLDEQDWIDYRAREIAKKEFSDLQANQTEQMQNAQMQQLQREEWDLKVEMHKEHLPDYQEVVSSSQQIVPDPALEFIRDSDMGPALAYHLAKNPEVVQSLWSLDERAMERRLLKMEMKVEEEISKPKAAQRQALSKAPAPVKPISKASGLVDEDSMSIEDWMKKRTKQVRG